MDKAQTFHIVTKELDFEIPISNFALYFELNNFFKYNFKLEEIDDFYFCKIKSKDLFITFNYEGEVFCSIKDEGAFLGKFNKEILLFFDKKNENNKSEVFLKLINDQFISYTFDITPDEYEISNKLKINIKPKYVEIKKIYYMSEFSKVEEDLSKFITLYEQKE